MKKFLFKGTAIFALLFFVCFPIITHSQSLSIPNNLTPEERIGQIENLQRSNVEGSVSVFKDIVENDTNISVRKGALSALGQVTRQDNLTEVRTFLKQIILQEENRVLKSDALASLHLLKNRFPEEKKGEMEIDLKGDIKKGSTVTLIVKISSTVDVERASVGLIKLHKNLILVSGPRQWKSNLLENEQKSLEYQISLEETGRYFIPFYLKLDFGNRVDYEITKKRIVFEVYENRGGIIKPAHPDYPKQIKRQIKIER